MPSSYSDSREIDEITAELQEIVETRYGGEDFWYWLIDYRPSGWWAMVEESRHFNDEGEYLGQTREEAIAAINILMNDQQKAAQP